MTLTARHADELRRVLEGLRTVIEVRLEERRVPESAAPSRRPLALDGAAGIPPLSTYAGEGPLADLVRSCDLTAAEALILVAAVAPETDEAFGISLARLSDRPGTTGVTGEVARTLVARTFEGRLAAADLLGPDRALRALGLVRLEPSADGALAGRLVPDRDMVAWVLGRRRVSPEEAGEFDVTPLRTVHGFDDIVVTDHVRERLRAVLARILHQRQVVEGWGFGRHHDNVGGVVVLFHGPPGTGKTMSAAVLAKEAGLPAYSVDLSSLVSKFIGETEKNLARLFERAERERCVLVFDEADALFGRRTEVQDAHDRYANQEVGYLLQRIERHHGVVILATNLLANIDEAFQRRIDVEVEFSEPTVTERLGLWTRVLPPPLPVAPIDFRGLAERYELTGAQIRNAAVEAAYLAAADGGVVTERHLVSGVRAQYARAGRMLPADATAR